MASSYSSSYNSPCAACKFLRRKCMPGCIFAPYFPPEEPHKFANVHKIFGASNVTKLLNELLPHQREDAVNSLAYEAEARVKDPVYGCVGAISFLQIQVQHLQKELDAANDNLIRLAYCSDDHPQHRHIPTALPALCGPNSGQLQQHHETTLMSSMFQSSLGHGGGRRASGFGSGVIDHGTLYPQNPNINTTGGFNLINACALSWTSTDASGNGNEESFGDQSNI